MAFNEGVRTYYAGAAVLANRRVKFTAATTTTPPEVEHAGDGEEYIGVSEYGVDANDPVSVKLKNHSGTVAVTAGVAFAVGEALYGAADGKVSNVVSGTQQATAHEAATADGDVVEALLFLA